MLTGAALRSRCSGGGDHATDGDVLSGYTVRKLVGEPEALVSQAAAMFDAVNPSVYRLLDSR
jgi:hypothetical protein